LIGPSFCEHKKIKSICKICLGGSICPHNKVKFNCKECLGGAYCLHNKLKIYCKICDGSGYCVHDKFKKNCRAQHTTPTCVLLTVYALTLARFSKVQKFMLNILHCLRHPVHEDVEKIIGNFSSSFLSCF
jgi:hypothetical protein